MKGRDLLNAVKTAASASPCLGIPVGKPVKAFLRPVVTGSADEASEDVVHLSVWRNKFVTAFLTEFDATPERTAKWLREAIANDDSRILFMVDDLEGNTFGYIGLAFIDWDKNAGEADSVVRGEWAAPGLMTEVLRTLLTWARGQLGLETIGVRVRSDNPALGFYKKFGFQELERVPLVRSERDNMIVWSEDPSHIPESPEAPHLVHMTLPG
jgi:RimJ/RimL family protein N-acetyltransferase